MIHTPNYRPADHRSRREIDQAISVVMGLRRCSAEQALGVITGVVHANGIGLGGVSRALLGLVTGDAAPAAGEAVVHWDALLNSPAQD
ncbi:hisitidine kinase [Mycobacterium avium subsp. paratuberculosis 08-8281]|uniref:ANTAR domain-containing protein n=1 Tax=Mycobacterium avium TaxID=1764 RepID=UPI000213AF3C|nr:ANTAR domain-containing protein [Mycobacterium avium]ETB09043.1 hisitidine kinase [Mycobacterium avium subsp. paratuberculosis 08-8281]ETB34949.1 hisitidine kinase [Mycobacterium avium subsp. paratuberculosis 11-1786]QPM73232.1 ANTAR domain-containing protein [Mycobacterium avium subsp. paratuberculosis S397]